MSPSARLCASIALALALSSACVAGAATPGFRVRIGERLTDGSGGGRPVLNLVAGYDDGAGGVLSAPVARVEFVVDRRQFDSAALERLPRAPAGTRLGWVAPTGSAVQFTLTVAGASGDPATGEPLVQTAIAVPDEYVPLVGATSWPGPLLRLGRHQVTLSYDEQLLTQHVHGAGVDYIPDALQISLLGRWIRNPSSSAVLQVGVMAWPCTDLACTGVGLASSDRLVVSLPRPVTIRAPRRALYGQNATFAGTGRPGDSVHLTRVRPAGRRPVCTPTTAGEPEPCSPRWKAIYDRLAETAKVGRDGRWTLRVPLRTALRPTLLGGAHDATGTYAVVEYTGAKPWNTPTYNGGAFSIITAAPNRTRVVLDHPRMSVRRAGSRLTLRVQVPGGDPNVRVRLTAGARTLAAGALDANGAYRTTVRTPRAGGRVKALASVPGAGPASASAAIP